MWLHNLIEGFGIAYRIGATGAAFALCLYEAAVAITAIAKKPAWEGLSRAARRIAFGVILILFALLGTFISGAMWI